MQAAKRLDTLLHAVGDPRRRAMFDRIAASDGVSVTQLTDGSGVTQGAVSQHLKILRDAGLVVGHPQGRNVFYHAKPDGLGPLVTWLGHYEVFWKDRMAELRALLKEMEE